MRLVWAVIPLVLIGSSILTIAQIFADDDYAEFIIDGYTITTNSNNVIDILLDWDSEYLPELSVNFTEQYTGQFQIQIPKNMPRTMNLDFETSLMMETNDPINEHIIEVNNTLIDDRVTETESLCYYIITVELSEADYFKIGTGSVASGRWEPVTIQNKECDTIYDDLVHRVDDMPLQTFTPLLKQSQLGISIDEIQCKENLVLIQKHDGSPSCIKKKNFEKLIQRNWGQAIPYNNLVMTDTPSEVYLPGMPISFKVTETGWGNTCNSMLLSITNLDTDEIVWDRSEIHPCPPTFKDDFFIHVSYVPDSRVSELSFEEIGNYKLKIESRHETLEHSFSVKLGDLENEN